MSRYEVSDEALENPDVAIVGMAARLPGASNVREFWNNLRAGRECIARLSDEQLLEAGVPRAHLSDPSYVKAAAVLNDLEQFDPAFFGFSRREATVLDPQHRHFLEVACEALEAAGVVPQQFPGPIGVFAGAGMHTYLPYHLFTNPELMRSMGLFLVRHTGNDKDFLSTRLSYCLDLRGPSVNVQTACSTSLVAVHMAVQSLLTEECDLALAGGVTIELPHGHGYHYQEGEILSPDGHCRPFEASSRGTVFGSGAGVVVLRRLRDAMEHGDHIHAVIKGSAINNDGSRKVGYLAPSVDGQAECVAEALQVAGLTAGDISYVECHGTGTPVGDPIEVAALTEAFEGVERAGEACGIGSVKSNIGHLDTAAGVASLIKVAQMLEHEELVPTLHFERPNPEIDFSHTPFHVVAASRRWSRAESPRRAGVSSLGVGGTNAHVIVEEPPRERPRAPASRSVQPLLLSARSPASLDAYSERLADHLESYPDLDLRDVAQTLCARRAHRHVRVLAAASTKEAAQLLREPQPQRVVDQVRGDASPAVIYLFPGGGAQYPNMARHVYDSEPVFREAVDACLEILERREGLSLRELMFPAPGAEAEAAARLERPSRTLPALLTIEIAYTRLLASWDVEPALMIGHSVGEYAAAHWAGVIDLETALAIVCMRGRLFEKAPPGGMISVPLSEAELSPLLGPELSIGVVNTPDLTVVSGPAEALEALEGRLRERDVETQRLRIEVAAHSPLLDPVLDEFAAFMATQRLSPPTRGYLSNLTAQPVAGDGLNADYFVQHLRQRVRFSECLQHAFERYPDAVLLEVGPGQALTSLLRAHPGRTARHVGMAVSPHAKDRGHDCAQLLTTMGRMFALGAGPDMGTVLGASERRVLPLPTTPWEHERCWIEPGARFFLHEEQDAQGLAREPDFERWFFAPVFREQAPEAAAPVAGERWLLIAEPGPLLEALSHEAQARGVQVSTATPGPRFEQLSPAAYRLRIDDPASYVALLDAVEREGGGPRRVVHLLCLTQSALASGAEPSEAILEHTFFSAMHLGQALVAQDVEQALDLLVVTSRGYAVAGERVQHPLHALAQGPVSVLGRELPEARGRLFDLDALDDPDACARSLVAELACEGDHTVTAVRQGRRYVRSVSHVSLDPHGDAGPPLPERPVVLFTGGLGGMARSLAASLVKSRGARIALLSRSELPPRGQWRALAERHDEPRARLLRALLSLEDAGAELSYVRADVCAPQQLREALGEVAHHYGRIDVVVHAAGTLDDAPLSQKTRESARSVLAPKVDGSYQLLDALRGHSPKAVVLVGSTSALLGPPGQVDYAAANAGVEALARAAEAQLPGARVCALGYGIWRDVGMAARAGRPGSPGGVAAVGPHPLLGPPRVVEGATQFETPLTTERWVLDEHRVRGSQSVLPGTAMLEVVRAAGQAVLGVGAGTALELSGVTFLSPVTLADDEHRILVVSVSPTPDAGVVDVTLATRTSGGTLERHATGRVGLTSATPPPAPEPSRIAARCQHKSVRFMPGEQALPQDAYLAFGARWKVVRRMRHGTHEALAELELRNSFEADLPTWALHPGLMDIATGFAFSLADGSGTDDRVRVPVSYGKVRVFRPLVRQLVSHVRMRAESTSPDVAVFDADVADLEGNLLVHIEGYTTKRISPRALGAGEGSRKPPTLLDRWLPLGLSEAEGARILERVLDSSATFSAVYASPVSLFALMQDLAPRAPGKEPRASLVPKAPAATEAAPRDDVERKLAEMWAALLGLDEVGIHDEFFELGGHSLIAVRLFSRVKKTFGVELSLAVLFEAPTIEGCAALIREQLGLSLEVAPQGDVQAAAEAEVVPAAQVAPATPGFSPLVPIQRGSGGTPFFCVHGAGGNVLNFRDLAVRLGKQQTFYGLQARGVDGGEPVDRIEQMAALYLQAVRSVQPRGPYLLGGYSGGGVVAYEMAQQLRRAGERVAVLALLDTFHPWVQPRRRSVDEMVQELREGGWAYFSDALQGLIKRNVDTFSIRARTAFFLRYGLPLPLELREMHLTSTFTQAAAQYVPQPYHGPTTLYRAREVFVAFDHVGPRLGWGDLIPNLDVVEVPGGHDTVVVDPNVRVITDHLRRLIDAVMYERRCQSRETP